MNGYDPTAEESTDVGRQSALAPPSTYKVLGEINDTGATGVVGHSTASTGTGWGVYGQADSTSDGAAGVRGEATASTGGVYGVVGETAADDPLAAGVKGVTSTGASAVRAKATGGSNGIEATAESSGYAVWARNTGTSGQPSDYGVLGETDTAADGVAAVKGAARATDVTQAYGVEGVTEASATSSTNPMGVRGESTANSGRAYGVYGTVSSSNGYGVYANTATPGGPALGTSGDAEIGGTVSKTANATAYRSTNQAIDSGRSTQIAFDAVSGDDFGAFVTSGSASNTGAYVVPKPGDYRVDLQISWASRVSAGVLHEAEIRVDGTPKAEEYVEVPGDAGDAFIANSLSKVLMNLSSGNDIEAFVYQDSGSSEDLYGQERATYMSVSHVG